MLHKNISWGAKFTFINWIILEIIWGHICMEIILCMSLQMMHRLRLDVFLVIRSSRRKLNKDLIRRLGCWSKLQPCIYIYIYGDDLPFNLPPPYYSCHCCRTIPTIPWPPLSPKSVNTQTLIDLCCQNSYTATFFARKHPNFITSQPHKSIHS